MHFRFKPRRNPGSQSQHRSVKDPVYRVGDKLDLLIKTDRQVWLYCFYRQSDAKWVKIFPNRYHRDPSLPGKRMHTMPGENLPFDLRFTEPAGIELVKCFATTRDVSGELPDQIAALDLEPLPASLDWRLPRIFRTIRKAGVRANPFGLYDVYGNVVEWLEDCRNDTYTGAPTDGRAWKSGNCSMRGLRGGSWNFNPGLLHSADREGVRSDYRDVFIGFRVARTLDR